MNLLFVCSENRLRSPTAERVFSEYPGVKANCDFQLSLTVRDVSDEEADGLEHFGLRWQR